MKECRRIYSASVAWPTDGFLSVGHSGPATLPPTRKDRMMRSDIFSLSKLQISFERQSSAIRFEQRPSLVDESSEPPVGVLLMVL